MRFLKLTLAKPCCNMTFRPLLKFNLIVGAILLFTLASRTACSQTVSATDLGTSNVDIYKTFRQEVYGFRISSTGGNSTLTALTTQPTAGTYTTADIIDFELYFNTVDNFASASLVSTSGLSAGSGEVINFNSFAQLIADDGFDKYFYIAANVAPGATLGNTFSIPFFDVSNFTFSKAVVFSGSSLGPSGTKTIQDQYPFITTWKTDNPGTSNDDQVTIPTTGTGYFFNVDWGDGMTDTDVTGDITHTYATPGTYTVSITGAFPRIYFNAASYRPDKDSRKLLTVEQWGNIGWASMASAFSGCVNLRINAVDAPDLTNVTSMSEMFYEASVMDDNINHWNVSNVTSMFRTFNNAEAFNQPLDGWDVSNVTDMTDMFAYASSFNQNISSWIVDNVQYMSSMFAGASSFNQNIGG
ncbi:MAG: BspA family leucine-rich repeat surface protein, partial [Cyclobacteriaceae bacterium]|nr:BspA family leucine-rich repeat surface protein [Cyclobacteriaceae bacterium]